jgi:hypothetical protein
VFLLLYNQYFLGIKYQKKNYSSAIQISVCILRFFSVAAITLSVR